MLIAILFFITIFLIVATTMRILHFHIMITKFRNKEEYNFWKDTAWIPAYTGGILNIWEILPDIENSYKDKDDPRIGIAKRKKNMTFIILLIEIILMIVIATQLDKV